MDGLWTDMVLHSLHIMVDDLRVKPEELKKVA